MTRPVSVGVVVLVAVVVLAGISGPMILVGVGTANSAGPQQPSGEDTVSTASTAASDDVDSQDFDSTTFEITVHENGSATWTFRHEQRLEDAEAERNFDTFAEEFESEETGLYDRFTNQAEALTETGSEMTDREMEATDFNRSASPEHGLNTMGVVEMSFRWEGFAEVEDDRIVVGDVFRNMYISEDQSIVIVPDGNLVFTEAEPDGEYTSNSLTDASSITWNGEQEFLDERPRVVLQDADDVGGSGSGNTGPSNSGTELSSVSVLLGIVVLTLGIGVAALWYRTQQSGDETTSAEPTETPPAAASESEPETDDDADTNVLPEDELLTDEDRVLKLIRKNGGRMKQVNIVEETGWSKSKVSMLLSEMESEGNISKLRVGRENIISLEGFEPEATKSPFDE
ncbi:MULTISPECIES: helix-turn-helix transcriptional regulator [Natrialbaceae]|uniref:helix-turn-helix transcriptional regulator n=1 Tax=Natrialbaceae TaxID=1644061 RepID=UPI00207D59F0|nr:helix-turn-helix domain-containing protein [Natronococcus sp. CG52]